MIIYSKMRAMKKVYTLIILIGAFQLTAFSQGNDFRHVRWGWSMEEVKSNETAIPCQSQIPNMSKNDCLCFNEKLGGKPYELYYCFQENKLESASYKRYETNANLDSFTDDFYALKKVLEDKYGQDNFIIKKESVGYSEYTPMAESNKDLSQLLKKGDFLVQIIWEPSDRTRIILNYEALNLAKGNTCNLSINYYPSTKNLIYDNNSFSREDLDKL